MDKDNLNLKKLISEYKPEETTEKIRALKHSLLIKQDVEEIILTKRKYSKLKFDTLQQMCIKRANFLYTNYTNIFNKLVKGELNLEILGRLIMILQKIEKGQCDQHEASVIVGTILKELYIDSALKKQEKSDAKHKAKEKRKRNGKKITWAEYKKTLL
mgnify:FL=1|tara:strand:+ start:3933 stop:4406 length:474 start_codon:yes stop_codon:yes gene_type:complete